MRKTKGATCRDCYMGARASTWLTLPCSNCGTEFRLMRAEHEKKTRRGQVNRYCSPACSTAALRTAGRPCQRCGQPTGSKDPGRRYCSVQCRTAARPAKREKDCPQCGERFAYSSTRQVYCTRQCADRAHSTRMVGVGNSRYKTGTSYAEWFRRMRPLILERDGRRCVVCSAAPSIVVTWRGQQVTRSQLVIHHLNERPWDNRPENLIALCSKCHAVHHKSRQTPWPWFADYAASATRSMTSRWRTTATSLQTKFSSTTAC